MPRPHRDLFDRIASFAALLAAARRAMKGKRRKAGAAAFFANLERENPPAGARASGLILPARALCRDQRARSKA